MFVTVHCYILRNVIRSGVNWIMDSDDVFGNVLTKCRGKIIVTTLFENDVPIVRGVQTIIRIYVTVLSGHERRIFMRNDAGHV